MSSPDTARAYARVALAGNPSDGYGGATLALTVGNYFAGVSVRAHPTLAVEPDSDLVRAAAVRFAREVHTGASAARLTWKTSIPREVGLGGSSALVIATARALCELSGVELAPARLAAFALAVEADDLGIAAGPQDRIAQAHEGLVLMDFGGAEPAVERLDPDLLPPLVIAHSRTARAPSGHIHNDLRERVRGGDRDALASIDELARHAHLAREALVARDHEAFGRCLDASFDARARLVELDSRQARLVDVARASGAAANYAGSGGAVICACRDDDHRHQVVEAFEREGCVTALPVIGPRSRI